MMPGMTREVRLSTNTLVDLAKIAFPSSATSEPVDDNPSETNQIYSRQATVSHGVEDA